MGQTRAEHRFLWSAVDDPQANGARLTSAGRRTGHRCNTGFGLLAFLVLTVRFFNGVDVAGRTCRLASRTKIAMKNRTRRRVDHRFLWSAQLRSSGFSRVPSCGPTSFQCCYCARRTGLDTNENSSILRNLDRLRLWCEGACITDLQRWWSVSNSSSVRGQSDPKSLERLRSASTFPPVWQRAQ